MARFRTGSKGWALPKGSLFRPWGKQARWSFKGQARQARRSAQYKSRYYIRPRGEYDPVGRRPEDIRKQDWEIKQDKALGVLSQLFGFHIASVYRQRQHRGVSPYFREPDYLPPHSLYLFPRNLYKRPVKRRFPFPPPEAFTRRGIKVSYKKKHLCFDFSSYNNVQKIPRS